MNSEDQDTEIQLSSRDRMALYRGRAVAAYAKVDWELFMLLQALLDTPHVTAGDIFYNIVNTRSRNAIFTNLLKDRCASTKSFWSSLLSEYGKLSLTRNNIIHWTDRGQNSELRPPNLLAHDDNTPSLCIMDLKHFCSKADDIAKAIWMFTRINFPEPGDKIIEEIREKWIECFNERFEFPFPDHHPLHPSNR